MNANSPKRPDRKKELEIPPKPQKPLKPQSPQKPQKPQLKPQWTAKEKDFLFSRLHSLAVSQIARELGKSERAVRLFLHRNRTNPKAAVKYNRILVILKTAFARPEYFRPTRDFYVAVGIGQKRWWALYKGVIAASDEECRRVARHLDVDPHELFKNLQLELFP